VSEQSVDPLRRRERLIRIFVLLFAVALFTYGLGAGSLWDVDESRYAEISREILATGDPITMHLGGRPWFGAPPLWMWLQAASGRLFGFTETAMRGWAPIFGVIGVGATMALGREWFGPRTALLSGLIIATMLEYLLLSRLAVLDVVKMAFVLLALHAFYRGYRDRSRPDYLRAFGYIALATLTRGPIVLVLPALVLFAFLAYRGALGRWREIPWAWGGLLYLAIAAPWYVLEGLRAGPAFLHAAFAGATAIRIFRTIGTHAASPLYHVPVLILGAAPWTAFLPGAFAFHYARRWQDGSLLCLLWCAGAFLVAILLGERLPNEVFAIYPIAAIAVARLWEEFLSQGGTVLRRTLAVSFFLQIGVVIFLIAAAVAFATARYPREFVAVRDALIPPLEILVLGAGVTAALFRYRRYTTAFLALPATMAVFVAVLYTVTVPAVETQKPMKPLSDLLARRLQPGDRLIGYRIDALVSLEYYTQHPVDWVDDPAVLRQDMCAPGRAFLVMSRDQLDGTLGPSRGATADPPPLLDVASKLRTVGLRGAIVILVKPAPLTCGGEA
jgi:4-amino-4-deoxy-L-arabinose transferase-like glycosyltransferase